VLIPVYLPGIKPTSGDIGQPLAIIFDYCPPFNKLSIFFYPFISYIHPASLLHYSKKLQANRERSSA